MLGLLERGAAAILATTLLAGCSTTVLAGKPGVTVALNRWAVFTPAAGAPSAGFIFYPGGYVDWRAYAPAAREIARAGFLVAVAPEAQQDAVVAASVALLKSLE